MTSSRSSGFALRDLLAVTAAGALLLFLTTPALRLARKQTKSAICLNNQRQIMKAWELYAGNHGGLLVPNEEDATTRGGHNWFLGTATGIGDPPQPRNLRDPSVNMLAPYLDFSDRSENMFHCPADSAKVLIGGRVRVPTVRSIAMNQAVGSACLSIAHLIPRSAPDAPWLDGAHNHYRGKTFRTFGRSSDFVAPDQTWVMIDEDPRSINDSGFGQPGWNPQNPGASAVRWVDYPATFHGRAGAISYADGHVEMHAWRGLWTESSGALPSSSVLPAQRADWEWLATRTAQPLPK